MKQKAKIHIQEIDNSFEKDILMYLDKKGKCLYGEIIKELQISASRGQKAIYSLLNKGLIKHKEKSSFIELNVELH
jgi:DNA-binding MarR family transcriptional regulator